MDEPDHKVFRDLTKDWFMPNNIRKVEGRVQAIAKAAVDRMLELGPEIDFVRDVAIWYPLRVIMMILGVPEEDEPRMLQLTQELFGADDPELRRGDATPEDRDAVVMDFARYFTQMTADRRAHPGDDVATVIANARIDGEPIGELEAISYYIILATAGHDTTSSSTAGGLLAFLEHPEELRKAREDPAILTPAVEEVVRWVTPVKHFLRYATEDYELRGKVVRAGDALMMLYPSANRDEDVFDEPFRFLADRRPNRHLLAKMEMRDTSTRSCSGAWSASSWPASRGSRTPSSWVDSRPCRYGSRRSSGRVVKRYGSSWPCSPSSCSVSSRSACRCRSSS